MEQNSHTTEKTLFERALLASRLVDTAELVEAMRGFPAGAPGDRAESDRRIASRLIERGLLNEWQVEQLRAGRTKFTLGPYLILDAIGRGGMGHVFQGRHELLGRVEAIKVLPKARSTPLAITNFQHEIRAQAQLDHPNLVRVSYADKDGDTYFLVTEFVPGVDLRRLVRRRGALPHDQAAHIIAQAADALEYAHRRGLVHRDVKPGNLLVRPDGLVKVTDLGLAWYLEDSFGAAPTGEGKVVGTCDYIAPESITTPDQIIPVSDIYSLGCTLYYALTGKVPFPGGNPSDKMRRQRLDQPIEPRAFNPDLPEELTELLAEMMEKDHRQRTPSAAAVADRLRRFVNDDSADGVASLVAACERATAGGHSAGEGRDIGETLDGITEDDLGSHPEPPLEWPSQASQATDPIASAAQDTLADGRPEDPAAGRRDWPVRLTVGLALSATVAIIIAVLLRYA